MDDIQRAKRLSDHDLALRVLHLADAIDLTDEATAVIEEAAQRLIDRRGPQDDLSPARNTTP